MKFNIGFDMGIVLAKGIIFSLLTVVFFMPAMILRLTPMIEKTGHRSFMPDLISSAAGFTVSGTGVLILSQYS